MLSLTAFVPQHCGKPMREVTESDEAAVGVLAWICDRCKFEIQTLPCYPDSEPPPIPVRVNNSKHSRDPRLYGIRRRFFRWEVRIAGGRHGVWLYVGMTRSVNEAIKMRDEAKRKKQLA